MDLPKIYSPGDTEDKWYAYWLEHKFFHSEPDEREPYTIVIPPPNVTGVLHMGHMLNNTLQDVLVRRARMKGYNACWVPGTDHASIATEAKVVNMLREKGIKKSSLTRERFLEYAFEWKEKHGGIILEQLRKLGCSCDWQRTRFTMEEELSKAVIKVFVDLHNKGHVYRGERMINWDPVAKTALSNEEVIYKEVESTLYYVRYRVEGKNEDWLTIATTRPETILGDTAICVHPKDARYLHLHGKMAFVPLINRAIPIIPDEYVEMEFGTGALKITPAHDPNDFQIGLRHKLPIINILNADGSLNQAAQLYIDEDRFTARKLLVKDLERGNFLVKTESLQNKVGFSERTDAIIEPRLSLQWFLNMKAFAGPAVENVANDHIRFIPPKYKNTYRHWMENIQDWCISRQLWWGQQIPAWYLPDGGFVVAETPELALEKARQQTSNPELELKDLKQDEDVVDTWFSSWLWPISVFDGFKDPDNKDINYYYPTNVLVTGWDIIFFWVARMIMAGYEFRGEKPFSDVYFTGMVRDSLRRKMSKQLGNSPDPLKLIEQYGADGVRVGMLLSAPAGNDLLFDEKLCEQGRNFANKIWNALRLVKSWKIEEQQTPKNNFAISWFESKLNKTLAEIEDSFSTYRISEALNSLYTLIWDDFCAWYLEFIKPAQGESLDKQTFTATIHFFEKLMKALHPFMPFLTEEVYQQLKERAENDSIMVAAYPEINAADEEILKKGETAKEIITRLRDIRNKNNMKPRDEISLYANVTNFSFYHDFSELIATKGFLATFVAIDSEPDNSVSFIINNDKFYAGLSKQINLEDERNKISDELEYIKGFINSVQKKLSNRQFVDNAPSSVIDKERQKLADGENKLKILLESLEKLN